MVGINLSNVTYHYQTKAIFNKVTLSIPSKEITCLVGANGSGKSTLLKLCAGLLTPDEGQITLDNITLSTISRKALAKKISYLPQQCQIPANLTIREYVALGRFCHQSWFSSLSFTDKEAIERAIFLSGLETLANHPVNALSFGQKQRARIALMLAQESPYLFLDEPMTGLDLKQQQNMLELLFNLNHDHAKTIVLILHDLQQVSALAHHAILLKSGHILAKGFPQKLFNKELLSDLFDYSFQGTFFIPEKFHREDSFCISKVQ